MSYSIVYCVHKDTIYPEIWGLVYYELIVQNEFGSLIFTAISLLLEVLNVPSYYPIISLMK